MRIFTIIATVINMATKTARNIDIEAKRENSILDTAISRKNSAAISAVILRIVKILIQLINAVIKSGTANFVFVRNAEKNNPTKKRMAIKGTTQQQLSKIIEVIVSI